MVKVEIDVAADLLGALRDASQALAEFSRTIQRIEKNLERAPLGAMSSDLFEPIQTAKVAARDVRNTFFDVKIAIEGMV